MRALHLVLVLGLASANTVPAAESAAAPSLVTPEPQVLAILTHRIWRIEPPPLAGMTPIRRVVTTTIQRVEAQPEPEAVPPPPVDPSVRARILASRAARPKPVFVFLSATVYDHRRTLLRWFPNGRPAEEMTAWSNLDWNHFTSCPSFVHNGRQYHLFFGLGNESTATRLRLALRRGVPYRPPPIPDPAVLPDLTTTGLPTFVVTKGNAADTAALEPLRALHALYQTDGTRLAGACEARERARLAHEADLRAHPPEPADVLIRYSLTSSPPAGSTP